MFSLIMITDGAAQAASQDMEVLWIAHEPAMFLVLMKSHERGYELEQSGPELMILIGDCTD